MLLLIFLLLLPILVGSWARDRGRSFLSWFLLSLIITPIIAVIVLIILPKKERSLVAKLTSTLDGWSATLNRKSVALRAENRAKAQRTSELDARIKAEADVARADLLIAQRAHELAVAGSTLPFGNSGHSTSNGPPVFGKRR